MEKNDPRKLMIERLKPVVGDYFTTECPYGSDYHHLVTYLKDKKMEVPEDPLVLGGIISSLKTQKKLIKLLISRETYMELFKIEPKGEKERGKYRIFIPPQNQEAIDKINDFEESAKLRAEIEMGFTPYLSGKIIDNRLFDLIQLYAGKKEFLDVVVLKKLQKLEVDLNNIKVEAVDIVGAAILNCIKNARQLYQSFRTEMEEERKRTEREREEIMSKSPSN